MRIVAGLAFGWTRGKRIKIHISAIKDHGIGVGALVALLVVKGAARWIANNK
jgi:hypothetical protein